MAARQRIVSSLAADRDPFARAVADWLGHNKEWNDTLRAEADVRASCAAGDCQLPASDATGRTGLQDRLAREALTTNDPRLYALAFRTCTGSAHSGWCSALSAARWAQLEDRNALPWLFMFEEARQRKDEAGETEALFRMASASAFVDGTFAASGVIAGRAGESDDDTAAELALHLEAIGMSVAQSLPLHTFVQACRGRPIDDANRRQLCDRIANNLVERTDHLLMRQMGIAMGRALGWPDDRIDALRGETIAWFQVAGDDATTAESSTCEGMKRTSRRLARMDQIGEVPSLREQFAATGRSMAPFIAAERQRRLQAAALPPAPAPASAVRPP